MVAVEQNYPASEFAEGYVVGQTCVDSVDVVSFLCRKSYMSIRVRGVDLPCNTVVH